MSDSAGIYKNSAILALLRVIDPAISMIVIMAISRLLGKEILGAFSFLNSFSGMFFAASQMGLHTLIVREVARNKTEVSAYLSSVIVIGICTSSLLAFIMNLSKGYFGVSPETGRCIVIMSLQMLPTFTVYSFESIFVAFEKMELILYEQLLAGVCRGVLSLAAIFLGGGLTALVAANVVASLAAVAYCGRQYARRIGRMELSFSLERTVALLKQSPVFLFTTVLSMLSARIDVLLLTKLAGMTQVALYTAAYRLFEMCMILPQAYYKATFPRMAQLCKSGSREFALMSQEVIKNSSHYTLLVTPLAFAAAPLLIFLVYGASFGESSLIMQILLAGLIPWGGARILANILIAKDLQRLDMMASIVATALNIGLNLALIPRYGIAGAAAANTFSLTSFFLMEMLFVMRFVRKGAFSFLPGLAASAAGALAAVALFAASQYLAQAGWVASLAEACIFGGCVGWYVLRQTGLKSYLSALAAGKGG